MFYVAGKPIIASEIEVLQELKSQLALQGIYRFDKFIETENHIQFNCPIHKGGQERKPSCGITKNRIVTELGNGNKKVTEAGTVHCFQCGYTTSLPEMISGVLASSIKMESTSSTIANDKSRCTILVKSVFKLSLR